MQTGGSVLGLQHHLRMPMLSRLHGMEHCMSHTAQRQLARPKLHRHVIMVTCSNWVRTMS